jgi:hypothetical protein
MRFIFPDHPEYYVIGGLILVAVVGVVALYQYFFPPAVDRLRADPRYQAAFTLYNTNLQFENPTRDDRQAALAVAVTYLENEGVPADEARRNLQLTVAGYDRERSYDLRHEALAYEQLGAHELALEYFERAAMWQEDHDRTDYQFLQRCIARVRGKVRPG